MDSMAIFLLALSIQLTGAFFTFITMALYAYFKPEKFGRYYHTQALGEETPIFIVLFFWPITWLIWLIPSVENLPLLFEWAMQKGEMRRKWNKDVYTVDPNTIEKEDNTISY